MSEQHDRERAGDGTSSGSSGDGGVVEAIGTPGEDTAIADGEIVQAERGAAGTGSTSTDVPDRDEGVLDDAESDANATTEPPTGAIHGYEDLESDPGV